MLDVIVVVFFFCNDTATTEIYTLSLHDALPIWNTRRWNSEPSPQNVLPSTMPCSNRSRARDIPSPIGPPQSWRKRSEEHTSELQSRQYLVCRLLLEKKKQNTDTRRQSKQRQ